MFNRLRNRTFADDSRYSNLTPPPPPPPTGGGGGYPPPPPAPFPYPLAMALPVTYGYPPLYEREYVVYDTQDSKKDGKGAKSVIMSRDMLMLGLGVVGAVLIFKLVK